MSTEDTGTTATTEPTTAPEAPGTEGQQTETPPTDNSPKTPEWYEKELEKVRREAASHRTKLRDTEAKLAAAKTPEEYEAARTELIEANQKLERDLLVERLGKGLPDDLVETLRQAQGDEKALKSLADTLRKYAPDPGENSTAPLAGGLNPKEPDDGFDPAQVARDLRAGRL